MTYTYMNEDEPMNIILSTYVSSHCYYIDYDRMNFISYSTCLKVVNIMHEIFHLMSIMHYDLDDAHYCIYLLHKVCEYLRISRYTKMFKIMSEYEQLDEWNHRWEHIERFLGEDMRLIKESVIVSDKVDTRSYIERYIGKVMPSPTKYLRNYLRKVKP